MDREDRWDLYIREKQKREAGNLDRVNPLIKEFLTYLQGEEVQRVLDLGCGMGRHSQFLAKHGFQVIGCDISKETIELAEHYASSNNLKVDFIQADYIDLPFNNSVFGAAIAIDTLHHDYLENIFLAIQEVHRVLAPEGLFCLNPLSVNDGLCGAGRKLGEKLYLIHRIPHYFFTDYEIRLLLERASFEIVSFETDTFEQEREGAMLGREKFRIIARKTSKRKAYYGPVHRPIF